MREGKKLVAVMKFIVGYLALLFLYVGALLELSQSLVYGLGSASSSLITSLCYAKTLLQEEEISCNVAIYR